MKSIVTREQLEERLPGYAVEEDTEMYLIVVVNSDRSHGFYITKGQEGDIEEVVDEVREYFERVKAA